MNIDPTLRNTARQELERRIAQERGRYYTPNGGIERFLNMIGREIPPNDGKIHIVILRAGNGVGKTCLASNLASYLTNNYPNKWFDAIPALKEFRRPNRGRILTTATAAQSAYDEELAKWLPGRGYRASKGGHKFNQHYKTFSTGAEFDLLTFDQNPMQGESVTLDWGIADEPMPRRHFSALKSRFRFGGIIFMLFTALEGSGWYKFQLEDDDRLGVDVHAMELSAEENCKEHGVRGLMPHSALASMWADFDESELPARKDGKYLSSSGVIFPTYRDEKWTDPAGTIVGHVMDRLEGYHRQCFDEDLFNFYCVMDPHDRKPFAISWEMLFPNDDWITVAEWPDESMRPFHKLKSCSWDPEMYARMIAATERSLAGRAADVRIIDPNFGNAPKATSKSTITQELSEAGEKLSWPLDFNGRVDDSIDEGHIAFRSWIGDPARGVRPKWFVMSHCKNTRFGAKNYAFKENRDDAKGLSESRELQFKDFMDLKRLMAMTVPHYNKIVRPNSAEYEALVAARAARHRPMTTPSGYRGMT